MRNPIVHTDTVSTTCAVSDQPHAPYTPSHLIAAYSARAFAAVRSSACATLHSGTFSIVSLPL